MAYDSFPWNGTTTGHASTGTIWSAPYSASEYSDVYAKLLTSYDTDGYIVPLSYTPTGGLPVSADNPASMNILVSRGAIYIFGRICESTATETLTVGTADATNPRIDRVVARLDISAQEWELALVAGTPAATPSLPALTQNATIFEVAIAYVWVAAGATTITNAVIHDERIFLHNFETLTKSLSQPNLLSNSEFMAFSRLNTVSASAGAPDGWTVVGTVTSYANETKPAQMSRGRAVKITAGASGAGISQTVQVLPSTVYAIKGLIRVTAGDVGAIVITTNSASPATISRQIHRTGAWIEYTVFYATESDASTLTLQLLANNNTDVIDYGQWIIAEGFVPGPFRQVRETIHFDYLVIDSDYFSDAFAVDNNTEINLASDYQGLILDGTKAVLLLLYASNTNTGSTTGVTIRSSGTGTADNGTLELRGLTANQTFKASTSVGLVNRRFRIDIYVGSGTLTASVFIKGVVV